MPDGSPPFGVSVVICCHNGAARLPATLSHLQAQQLRTPVPWEVVLVDNASTDDTVETARRCWATRPTAPLRIVHEPMLGQAHARRRGLAEASYEFVSFVDDDNWVCETWIEDAARFLEAHPEVGAVGGRSIAECEVPPPAWFATHSMLYAVSPPNQREGDCTVDPGTLWTAGMTLRRRAWLDTEEQGVPLLLTGRRGTSMGGGEDCELCLRLRMSGWKLWFNPRLTLRHYMPQGRLTWNYARRLYRGSGEIGAGLLPYAVVFTATAWRFKRWWVWQVLRETRGLLRNLPLLIRTLRGGNEGAAGVLETEMSLGKWLALVRGRGVFREGVRTVRRLRGTLRFGLADGGR